MTYIPATPDWQWFGSLNDEQLAEYVADNSNIDWLQDAERWRTGRKNVPSLRNYVPVLTAANGDGQLGFIAVDNNTTYGEKCSPSEFEEYAYTAASFVFDLFRPFDKSLATPLIDILLDKTGGGSSLSLPTMIAALQRLTGIRLPDTIVATGCFDNSRKRLLPVSPDTLPAKIRVAKRFGYKKIILVEGQEIPKNCPLEWELVSSDPLTAIFQLLNPKLTGSIPKDRHVSRLLFFADRQGKLKDNDEIIKTFLESNSPLIRSIACDILSRNALHQGETEEANTYRKQIASLKWNEFPNDYLGHYLRYESIAATAMLKIDLGIWNDEDETHQALDKRLEHLQKAIEGGFADRNDYFAALTLANTRAMRKRFISRYDCVSDFESAWHDLIFLFDDWKEIFKYAERIDKKSTLRRQLNYCLECLTDYWKKYKELPKWEKIDTFFNWIESDCKNWNKDAFDKITELNYRIIKKQEINVDVVIKRFEQKFPDASEYPNWILYENILRFGLGNTEQRQHCLSQLKKVELQVKQTSIHTLLALRTRKVLENNGYQVSDSPVAPPKDTPLRKIYDDLLSAPDTLIDRCPY